MIRILILEEQETLAEEMAAALRALNYDVLKAANAETAWDLFDGTTVHLVVADSAGGGLEFTRDLRDAGNITPVILVTDNDSRAERHRIFRSGADGYMILPPDGEELQMRVKSLLWRCRIVDDAVLRFGRCSLSADTLTLVTPDEEISLRRMEFLLLEKLLSYPGRIFTRPQLMDEIWGYDSESDPRTVDTHIRRLRKKLKEVEDIRLQTVRGLGYRAVMPRRLRRAEREKNSTED